MELWRISKRNLQSYIKDILCSKSDHRVDSKHDIIVSKFQLPSIPISPQTPPNEPPEVTNTKHRIIWSEEGVSKYRDLLSDTLLSMQNNWKNPPSPISFSVLLQCTNEALTSAAKASNKSIDLSKDKPPKHFTIPADVVDAANAKKEAHKVLKHF